MLCRNLENRFVVGILISCLSLMGCQDSSGPQMVPVEGKVLYNGKPLKFGSVAFQDARGQVSAGLVQADGTFALSTHTPGDGAAVGRYKVRVVCYSSQKPGFKESREPMGEMSLGKLLIPRKYTLYDLSRLTADVTEESGPLVFELTGS